ncbi:MAG TPA: DegT/DnrJ/EryC1/StrS family aminotransferase [Streptosporangiaceae bacterium]|nr:DegT/DnrJ/EryC1/StrS family aminotransferase [Streptosporangiaceae bacterium]
MITSKHLIVSDADTASVLTSLRSGELSGGGPLVREYEAALADWFGCSHAIACSSGTAAIYIALAAIGVCQGDEVIVPPTAPAMTALPVLALGATVRFADIRPAGFGLDPADVERTMTARTKAVIEVPMWGYADNIEELRELCSGSRIELLEDASQAHGSMAGRRLAGTGVAIGAFSTHARKLLATGEGGFLLTDAAEHARPAQRLRGLGQSDGGGEAFGDQFGLNFKLPGILAAMGLTQLARLGQRVRDRNAVADRWLAALGDLPDVEIVPRPRVHNCYGLAITVPARLRGRIDDALADCGVLTDTKAYSYRPLNEAPLFATRQRCKNALALIDGLIVLPCHEGVTGSVIDKSVSAMAGCG